MKLYSLTVMKSIKLTGLILGLCFTLFACKREEPVGVLDDNVNSTNEMVVSSSFDYSTTRDLTFDVSNVDSWGKQRVRLDIYDFIPSGGGKIVQSKFLEANGGLIGTISLPAVAEKVYIVLNFPDGSSVMRSARVEGGSVSYDFSPDKSSRKSVVVSTNCSSGCSNTINNHSGNFNVNSNTPGTIFCFTGNTTGNITINKGGVTVRICGTADINKISLNNGSHLEITDGADVSLKSLNLNSNGSLTVYDADLTIKNNFSPSGPVTNYGNLELLKQYNLNSSAHLYNYGSVAVNKKLNSSAAITNYGVIDVEEDVILNGASSTQSFCKILVGGKMTFNAPSTYEGYLGVQGKLTVNGGGAITLVDGAMIEGAEAVLNSSISGTGSSTSLVKVAGNTTINGGGSLNGSLQYCDANGVETNTGLVNSPASLACGAYIPTSMCNPVGNGSPQIVDSDNDGVADNVDLYPNDPNASGASYYPGEDQYATIAFEDLWPYSGDFDFNDLVVGYNYTMVTNASNKVVRVEAKFVTKAIGAGLTNGFGVQLGCSPSEVQSVTGSLLTENYITLAANGTEQGQNAATVIVFDNAFKTIKDAGGTKFVNTLSSEAHKEADTVEIAINFASSIDAAQLGMAPFNPFLIVGKDRGKEVHLPDHAPTALANQSYFGIGADDSQPSSGRYYKSDKNHPWALNIAADFDYPEEKNDIVTAYNFFAAWAQSGGASNQDWYIDLSGYRNTSKLYY